MARLRAVCVVLTLAGRTLAQWQADQRLTNDTAGSCTSLNNARRIAATGDDVHAVWNDNHDGNGEIYYKRSTDGGDSLGQ